MRAREERLIDQDRLFDVPALDVDRKARNGYSLSDIIDAYQRNGSVWRAGKELGVSGQSVHERLRAMGYPLANRDWDDEEVAEMVALSEHVPIGEIASRLGRTYAATVIQLSRRGIKSSRPRDTKIRRGAGYDKVSCARYIKQIDTSGTPVSRFAKANGLGVEMLCRALEQHFPEWWVAYRAAHSDLGETACPYCLRPFIPSNKKQTYCSRKCTSDARTDRLYFGGNRRKTVGLLEGICQLCGKQGMTGLTPHHLIGKENDPDDQFLIALCRGCHQIVTLLAGRPFSEESTSWESLISLVLLRRQGASTYAHGTYVYVEIEPLSEGEMEDELAMEAEA